MSQVGGDVGGRNSCAGNCSCSFSGPAKLQDPGSAFAQPEMIENHPEVLWPCQGF